MQKYRQYSCEVLLGFMICVVLWERSRARGTAYDEHLREVGQLSATNVMTREVETRKLMEWCVGASVEVYMVTGALGPSDHT